MANRSAGEFLVACPCGADGRVDVVGLEGGVGLRMVSTATKTAFLFRVSPFDPRFMF